MYRHSSQIAAATVLLYGLGFSAFAQPPLSVTISLPDSETWEVLDETVAGQSYSREWIPAGTTYETANWLIAEQRVRLDDKMSSMDFLEMIYAGSEDACTSASHDEPERIRINKHRVVIGRTMCARNIGEEFGTFSDRAVLVEDGFAYIVTSELRVPPMVVAGVLTFDRDKEPRAAGEFMDREERSRQVVRERIVIE
jgi:hypothetical protein